MIRKLLGASIAAMIAVSLLISGAMAAKLVCFSEDVIKGQMDINQCVAQGMLCGLIEDNGFVRILSPKEIELTKKINPKAFEMKAYGWKQYRQAPDIPPPLPVSREVQ
jgi:hypothetical protein